MKTFMLILVSLLIAQISVSQSFSINGTKRSLREECGIANTGSFIIGGTETEPNQYPWMAIQLRADGENGGIWCGAALVSDEWLITAAHCLGSFITGVRLGSHDQTASSEPHRVEIDVEEIIIHPSYNFPNNDIGLMKLAEKVEFNDYIRPICLPTQTEQEEEFWGVDVTGIGWGISDNNDHLEGLRHVDFSTITEDEENEFCNRAAEPSVICIDTSGGSEGICFGDSGSPLLYQRDNGQYATIGVASWVVSGCGNAYPDGYSFVPYNLDWIVEETGIELEP